MNSHKYFSTNQQMIDISNEMSVTKAYNDGYVLTRISRGHMNQTRSLRVNLSKFGLSSENRRVLRRTEGVDYTFHELPYQNYSWKIHKLGKLYYETKFGAGVMSASRIKDMFTKPEENNMNTVISYRLVSNNSNDLIVLDNQIGFTLCYKNSTLLHYAYPFYDLNSTIPNLGMGMMIRAIEYAKELKLEYVYLGSVTDVSATYKLQFQGLEWWDTSEWSLDLESLKQEIGKQKS